MIAQSRAFVLGGRSGLLGQALTQALQQQGWDVFATGRADFDATDTAALTTAIETYAPNVIFNAVAWTQVDAAEEHPKDSCTLNRALPLALGRIVKDTDMHLIHYSTDFVFNGRKGKPYSEEDATDPLCVYGNTKLEGEQALASLELDNCCIIRTAWLFGPNKGNFIHTILNACASRTDIQVVHDQIGSPTYTPDLADASVILANMRATGIVHVVNAGEASWCELASEAVTLAGEHCQVHAIDSSKWPQQAQRPAYSVLSTQRYTKLTGRTLRPWPQALRDYIFNTYLAEGR